MFWNFPPIDLNGSNWIIVQICKFLLCSVSPFGLSTWIIYLVAEKVTLKGKMLIYICIDRAVWLSCCWLYVHNTWSSSVFIQQRRNTLPLWWLVQWATICPGVTFLPNIPTFFKIAVVQFHMFHTLQRVVHWKKNLITFCFPLLLVWFCLVYLVL